MLIDTYLTDHHRPVIETKASDGRTNNASDRNDNSRDEQAHQSDNEGRQLLSLHDCCKIEVDGPVRTQGRKNDQDDSKGLHAIYAEPFAFSLFFMAMENDRDLLNE